MRLNCIVFAAFFFPVAPAFAGEFKAVDGSTFTYNGEMFRIANIYTPDMTSGECDAERRLGKVAKARLDQLILSGRIQIKRGDPLGGAEKNDKGQSLGLVSVNGNDVGTMLIEEHLARPWNGTAASWCKD